MKYCTLIVVLILLSGCDPTGASPADNGGEPTDLIKYRDEGSKVTCYRVHSYSGLSCVHDGNQQ